MRVRVLILSSVAVCAALAVPGPAFAQSAGDEQYSDPFGPEEPQQQQEQQPAQQEQQPQAPAEPTEPAPTPSTTTEDGSSGEVATAPAQSSDPSLPVTGLPALAMLIVGAVMLSSGVVVRRRL